MSICHRCSGSRVIFSVRNQLVQAGICQCIGKNCKLCSDQKIITTRDEKGRFFSKKCECVGLRQKIDLLNRIQIPGIYFDAEFTNFSKTDRLPKLKTAIDKSIKFIDSIENWEESNFSSDRKGLLFYGTAGTGKTRLMCVLLKELVMRQMIPCQFVEFTSLINDIKTGYDKGESENNLIAPLIEIEILGIDELGKGRRSDWWIGILDNIITRRYNAGKLTFFTTNYSIQKKIGYSEKFVAANKYSSSVDDDYSTQTLNERLNDRIYSRLCEMCVFIDMNFEDFRNRISHQEKEVEIL